MSIHCLFYSAMVRTCICCKYRVNKLESDVSLYGFPKDNNILKKWLLAIDTEEKICLSSRICSRHFKKDDFRYSLVGGNRFLKPGAVPSLHLNRVVKDDQSSDSKDSQNSQTIIFEEDQSINKVLSVADLRAEESRNNQSLNNTEIKKKVNTKNISIQYMCHSEPKVFERLSLPLAGQNEPKNRCKKFLYDVSWEEISKSSPVQSKIYWEVAMGKITRQKAVLKTLQQKVRRLKGRIEELQSLVKIKDIKK